MDRVADDLVSTATEKQKNHTLYMREYRKRKSEVSLDADRKKDAERKRQYRKREKEAKVAIADVSTTISATVKLQFRYHTTKFLRVH